MVINCLCVQHGFKGSFQDGLFRSRHSKTCFIYQFQVPSVIKRVTQMTFIKTSLSEFRNDPFLVLMKRTLSELSVRTRINITFHVQVCDLYLTYDRFIIDPNAIMTMDGLSSRCHKSETMTDYYITF